MGIYRSANTTLRLLFLLGLLCWTLGCQGEQIEASELQENASPCAGQEDGTIITLGAPSGCEYASACDEKGNSTVINEICIDELVTQQVETQDCSRSTDGKLIATGEPGSCQFETTCSEVGYTISVQIFCRGGVENEENLITYGCERSTTGLSCIDESVCSIRSQCSEGECQPVELLNCDDTNPCTDDTCDPELGCLYTSNTATCSDGDACTGGDQCVSGSCVGTPLTCVDDNPCTTGTCVEGEGCVYVTVDGPCDDGNACTGEDQCVGGQCVGTTVITCNDNNPCTNDTCKPSIGCENINNTLPCEDGNACTVNDTCAEGSCLSGAALACDDENPCTADACDISSGCIHEPTDGACNDADICTLDDICIDGVCSSLDSLSCTDDENPCTAEFCDPVEGCQSEALDGVILEVLSSGECGFDNVCDQDGTQSRNILICRSGVAQEERDIAECLRVTDGVGCDDGAFCTVDDTCLEGICTGSARDCSDQNSCTLDSCSQSLGCTSDLDEAICDSDTLSCQTLEQCRDDATSTDAYDACESAASEVALARSAAIAACANTAGCGADNPDPICTLEFCESEVVACLGPDGSPAGSDTCAEFLTCLETCDEGDDCRAGCLATISSDGFDALRTVYACGRESLCLQLDGTFDLTCLETECGDLSPSCFE